MLFTHDGKNVAKDVGLGDGAVNVGDDYLVGVMPEVDVAPAAASTWAST